MSIDIHALTGAYAVDALDDLERAQVERHLALCDDCRLEVDSLREAAAMMAESAAQAPSDALRRQVLAGIRTVRPMPPVLVRADDVRRATARRTSHLGTARRRVPALLAAAAALVVIGGAGATAWHPWDDRGVASSGPSVTTIRNVSSDYQRVEQAADRKVVKHRLGGQATATLILSHQLDLAVLETTKLPAPPAGMVYELWLFHDQVPVRAGLMPEGGDQTATLSGHPATADAAAITVEPAGGSDHPTSAAVAAFAFQQA